MSAAEPRMRKPKSSHNLLHHGLVGALLGFPLAIWLSGVLYYAANAAQDSATYQIAMWVVPLLWAGATAIAFMAPSKRICWIALLTGNALAFGLMKVLHP